jgi:murein DD-endopeptidase MepM/ murein hydrolase activator NlpD
MQTAACATWSTALLFAPGPTAHARRLAPSKKWQDINAVDFLAPAGTPLIAIVNGTVCDPAVNSACV